jgi:hypothetical protein
MYGLSMMTLGYIFYFISCLMCQLLPVCIGVYSVFLTACLNLTTCYESYESLEAIKINM